MQFWEKLYHIRIVVLQQLSLVLSLRKHMLLMGVHFVFFSTFGQQIVDNQCNVIPPGELTGDFKLVNGVGCAPLRVKVSNQQIISVENRYIFDYKGGNPYAYNTTADSNFTYTKSGIYYVMKLSKTTAGVLQRACRVVTVQNRTAPEFKVLVCSNGSVNLRITNHAVTEYEEYVIEWGDGNVTIMNRLNLSAQYRYRDVSSKQITVQGRHRISNCGEKSTQTISLETINKPAAISKLEILDASAGELTISNPNELELELYRQEGGGTFRTLGTTVKNSVEKVKVLVDTNRMFCYKIKARDSCVAALESNVVCTAFLKVIPEPEANGISFTPYRNPSDVKSVAVKRNDVLWWKPAINQFFKSDTEGQCGKDACYRLEITTQGATILSNRICVGPPPSLCNLLGSLFVPDVFTPNGDGVNDLLEIKGEIDGESQTLIYDRWGSVIFRSSVNVRHWNGSINGSPAPAGVYLYHIKVTDKIGRTFIKRGTVSLLR